MCNNNFTNPHSHTLSHLFSQEHFILFFYFSCNTHQHQFSRPTAKESGCLGEMLERCVKSDYSLTQLPSEAGGRALCAASSLARSGCPPLNIPVFSLCGSACHSALSTGWIIGPIDSLKVCMFDPCSSRHVCSAKVVSRLKFWIMFLYHCSYFRGKHQILLS